MLPALDKLGAALDEVLRSGVLTKRRFPGPRFEALLSARLGIPELAVCGSGTTAIQLACGALGLSGEVIVPAGRVFAPQGLARRMHMWPRCRRTLT